MISVTRRTPIAASPSDIWAFFRQLDDLYGQWHPEHLTWRTLKGAPLTDGAVVYVLEWIGPRRVDGRLRIEHVTEEESFSYRFAFPASLIGARGSFSLIPTDHDSTELVEEVHLGIRTPVLGRLLDLIIRIVMPLPELQRHVQQEGEHLAQRFGPP